MIRISSLVECFFGSPAGAIGLLPREVGVNKATPAPAGRGAVEYSVPEVRFRLVLLDATADRRKNPHEPATFFLHMMPYEGNHGTLDAATLAELRAALNQSLVSGSHGDELKEPLRKCAVEARERGIHAEQLLVALKSLWHDLPAIRDRPHGGIHAELLQQVIARCIQEYYSG